MCRRIRYRPYDTLSGNILARWTDHALTTRNAIKANDNPGPRDPYSVSCTITSGDGTELARGSYDSVTGLHAELAAISNLPSDVHYAKLTVDPPPCRRCAAILHYYRRRFSWTIRAPENAFAPTYHGAYDIPPGVRDMIITDLIEEQIVTEPEAERYEAAILSAFQGGTW